ncbi:MAG TPA: histidine ammonia-lyase [Bacteroidales bacterium]|nr:histidine ammonia-lyase [Bacteroidales bacterium]
MNLLIDSQPLTFEILESALTLGTHAELSREVVQRIQRCRKYLDEKILQQREPLYGITTGFGSLCNRTISTHDLAQLQRNLVVSHACGLGAPVDNTIVKLMLLLKAWGLAKGNSGVQVATVQRLLDLYNHGALPVVRELGSLGASGDLAPLAHLVLPLLGLGEVHYKGQIIPSSNLNKVLGLSPVELQSKEGLALLNGTQFMSAHGVYVMLKAKRLLYLADMIGAIAIEAYNGRIDPFLSELHAIRLHKGQQETASNIRMMLEGSRLIGKTGKAVQDPYSFRCIPQVHGAVKDTASYFGSVILTEINSVTDNPTIFPDEDKILSGGNFHGEPLAFALDFVSIALAELGNIAERRIYRLISGQRGLPEFLVAHPGLNSGFMIPQYAAASVVSQNKQLCTPASVDSITSSNEQEDHVSMGANAATKAVRVINNLERILALEMLTACQALEFRGIGETSPYLQAIIADYRKTVPFVTDDVLMYELIDNSLNFIREYRPDTSFLQKEN